MYFSLSEKIHGEPCYRESSVAGGEASALVKLATNESRDSSKHNLMKTSQGAEALFFRKRRWLLKSRRIFFVTFRRGRSDKYLSTTLNTRAI